MSRQRKRHRDVVNSQKMYIAERKACYKVGLYSDRKRWRKITELRGWEPKMAYWWDFLNYACYQHPEAINLQTKYLRGGQGR